MKELGKNLAQLIFVIMLMITLAVSTAALSQWADSGASADGSQNEQDMTAAATLTASATP